jgi:hypothetical protein
MEEKQERHYMGVFYLPKPQREHAQLTEALKSVARDVKVVPLGGNCVMYLLISEKPPHLYPVGRIMHTGDHYFFMEIGEYTTTNEFNAVQGWLDNHRPRR